MTKNRFGITTDLEKIGIVTISGETELRLDWTNDRHHAVKINSTSPKDVIDGLIDLARLIEKDSKAGNI